MSLTKCLRILFLFCAIVWGVDVFAQRSSTVDSLKLALQKVEYKVDKFRQQHQTGVLTSIAGGIIIAAPLVLVGEVVLPVLIIGSVVFIVGSITSLRSYRHLTFNVADHARNLADIKKHESDTKAKPKNWWTPRGNIAP